MLVALEKRGMAGNIRDALELSKKIIYQLSRWNVVLQNNLCRVKELKALLFTTVGLAQLNYTA